MLILFEVVKPSEYSLKRFQLLVQGVKFPLFHSHSFLLYAQESKIQIKLHSS